MVALSFSKLELDIFTEIYIITDGSFLMKFSAIDKLLKINIILELKLANPAPFKH